MAQHEELMKKTETMNVVMETNKMLREEKERLEQNLQQMQAKVCVFPVRSRSYNYYLSYKWINSGYFFKKTNLELFSGEETGVRYFAFTRSQCWAQWEKRHAAGREEAPRGGRQALEGSEPGSAASHLLS